ncbi:unnamed protein product [Closterium sp. NIES-53]
MGTFTTIRNVAKCAARMGQCFSSRFTSLRALVRTLPDITRHGYCFTDGIGAISPEAARALADAVAPYLDSPLGLAEGCAPMGGGGGGPWLRAPSAFQIRYAGVKGVVAVWPRGVMQRVEAQGASGLGTAPAAGDKGSSSGWQQQQQ